MALFCTSIMICSTCAGKSFESAVQGDVSYERQGSKVRCSDFTLNAHELPELQSRSAHPRQLVNQPTDIGFAHEE